MKRGLPRFGRAVLGVLRAYGIGIGLFAVIFAVLLGGITSAEQVSEEEQLRMLDDNIRRAVVACYAMEGAYPESLDYLKENYALRFDEDKYVVHYFIFASNIMPEYDILLRQRRGDG